MQGTTRRPRCCVHGASSSASQVGLLTTCADRVLTARADRVLAACWPCAVRGRVGLPTVRPRHRARLRCPRAHARRVGLDAETKHDSMCVFTRRCVGVCVCVCVCVLLHALRARMRTRGVRAVQWPQPRRIPLTPLLLCACVLVFDFRRTSGQGPAPTHVAQSQTEDQAQINEQENNVVERHHGVA